VLLALLVCGLLVPGQASAHSTLVSSIPAMNSQLYVSPEAVQLTFNERVEKELFFIRVHNQRGEPITTQEASIDADQRTIGLPLPKLAEGWYIVSYKVISADGHPISGSYVFTVGNAMNPVGKLTSTNPIHDHGSHGIDSKETWTYATARTLYYAALLLVAGWVIGSVLGGRIQRRETAATRDSVIRKRLAYAFLIVACLLMLMQMEQTLGNALDFGSLVSYFTGTNVGISWIATLAIAVTGIWLLGRSRILDIVWVALVFGAKSMNGHAIGFEPQWATIALDIIHLAAASIWVGGLAYLAVYSRRDRAHAIAFAPAFSRWALISIFALTATGIVSALIFLPDWSDVVHSAWGRWLIAKCILVALVIIVGACIRHQMKRSKEQLPSRLLRLDIGLALLIVVIVGIFTMLSPSPVNAPLHWEEQSPEIRMAADITPETTGMQTFHVQVWLPDGMKDPKYVQLKASDMNKPDLPPIEVPLNELNGDAETSRIAGFKRYHYMATGPYMPFPGNWKLELRIMNGNDDEMVYRNEMRIFAQ